MAEFINELKSISEKPLFVFTGQCSKIQSTDPCDTSRLGKQSLISNIDQSPFSHATVYESKSSLWSRIASAVNIRILLRNYLEEFGLQYTTSLWQDYEDHKLAKAIFPLHRTIIYCALCTCSIQTAVVICHHESSLIHEYTIRPDDRIMSSCCLGQDKMEGLKSIYYEVKENEVRAKSLLDSRIPAGTRFVDMWWLEERLSYLEDEDVEFHSQPSPESSQVVVIGEASSLFPIVQNAFRSRVPREGEVWQLQILPDNEGLQMVKFFGTFTLALGWPQKYYRV